MKHAIKNRKGFSLIEIMIAIAIVGILSAVVLVSLKSFGAKARSSKALASLSSAIPSMVSCWGNVSSSSDYVITPSSSGVICSINSSYGKWPSAGSGDLSTYRYSSSDIVGSGKLLKTGWFVALTSGFSDDNKIICCNSTMNSCEILPPSTSCASGLAW